MQIKTHSDDLFNEVIPYSYKSLKYSAQLQNFKWKYQGVVQRHSPGLACPGPGFTPSSASSKLTKSDTVVLTGVKFCQQVVDKTDH